MDRKSERVLAYIGFFGSTLLLTSRTIDTVRQPRAGVASRYGRRTASGPTCTASCLSLPLSLWGPDVTLSPQPTTKDWVWVDSMR